MSSSLGEQVLFCKLIRDGILKHLNPWKLRDLQRILELRCFKGLLPDADLRHSFETLWPATGQGASDDRSLSVFLLDDLAAMRVEEIRAVVSDGIHRQRGVGLPHTTIGAPLGFETMTKRELKQAYGALTYTPTSIFLNAIRGACVMRTLASGTRLPRRVTFKGWIFSFLLAAVESGLDIEVIERIQEEEFGGLDGIRVNQLMRAAANHGHLQIYIKTYFNP